MPEISQSSSPTPRVHLAHIDGLRALCALWVLLYHANGAGTIFPVRLPLFLQWIAWGHFAVPAFIVISGFCLMMPVVRKGELAGGAKHFYWKRIRRILPPYYVALLFFVVFNHVRSKSDILLHLLLLHNFNSQTFYGNINYSFWSIAVECQIYILFPLFVMAWKKWGLARSASVTLPLAYLCNSALQHTLLWGLCLHYIALFVIGAAGAEFAFSIHPKIAHFRERANFLTIAGLSTLTLIGLTVTYGHPPRDTSNDMTWVSGWTISGYNLLVALSVSCLLVSATVHNNPLRKVFSWKPLVWIGNFSYSLYLLHQPFVNQFAIRLPHHHVAPWASLLIFLVFVPVIIGLSYVFHLCFERPFMSSPAPKTERQAEQAAIDSPAP